MPVPGRVMLVILLGCAISFVSSSDTQAQTMRVSVSSGGTQGNGASTFPALSADGRFVAFESLASNLVPGDTNNREDVFVHDRSTGQLRRVSVSTDGTQANHESGRPSVSADGRFVAFHSFASNLVPGDTNQAYDVFVHDQVTGETARVSVASNGAQGNGSSVFPSISADGRFVAFASIASNLVPGDTNADMDIFVHDRQTGQTTRVSVASNGGQGSAGSFSPSISADGRHVAFTSAASNLVTGDTNSVVDVFVHDRLTGLTTRVNVASDGTQANGMSRDGVSLSADGRFVAFESLASNLVPADTNQGSDAFVHDRQTGQTTRVSVRSDGAEGNNTGVAAVQRPHLSADGRFVAFGSMASNMVTGDTNESIDAFVHDRLTGQTVRISLATDGSQGNAHSPRARLSGDGRLAALDSGATNLVPGDTNAAFDVFVVNLDSDGDGMTNGYETLFGLDPFDPADAAEDANGDGRTNLEAYHAGAHPRATTFRYLAEGAFGPFFDTRVALLNPTGTPATALVRFLPDTGAPVSRILFIPGSRRVTLEAAETLGLTVSAFSTVVESDTPLVVDRTMWWGGGYGSHAETSVPSPATTWYLAEGATHPGFNLFYLLQNPHPADITVTVTYLRPVGPALVRSYGVPAQTRRNIWVNQEGPPEVASSAVSAVLTSTQSFIVERAMYLDTPGRVLGAGHNSTGITTPATRWFLAEGATGPFFDLFILLANPDTTAADVRVTYLLPGGATVIRTYPVAPQSRFNIWVNDEGPALADTAVSAIVESTNGVPIIVERAMWWPGTTGAGTWHEAHNSAGTTESGTRWALADGEEGGPLAAETFVLIANTSAISGQARVTLLYEDASGPSEHILALPPTSRTNVAIQHFFPEASGRRFGVLIESLPGFDGAEAAQIVVERAMYFTVDGVPWLSGTNAVATRLDTGHPE